MNEIFDTAPFAYVGENTHYKELTPEEKEELKEIKNRVIKTENPSSEEVKENSASLLGEMLPQVIPESEEPDVDDVFADVDTDSELLQEALEDEICGGDIYYEKADFIGKLKGIFKKKDIAGIDYAKVEKAAKAYTSLRMSGARLRVSVSQNPEIRDTSKHRNLQRKIIIGEKEYRKLKEKLNKDEIAILNQYINGFETEFNKTVEKQIADIEDAKKAIANVKVEYTEITFDEDGNEIVTESALAATAAITGIVAGLVGFVVVASIIEKKTMKKCLKILKTDSDFIDPNDMTVKVYNIRKYMNSFKKDKEIKNKFVRTLQRVGDHMCVYSYKGKDIFAYTLTVDTTYGDNASLTEKKIYFNMIDESLEKFKDFYLSFACMKTHVKVLESYRWVLDFIKDHEKDKEEDVKESSDDILLEKGIDDDMKPILDKLHSKGYKTTSSSSGHNNLVKKGDRNDNGVLDEYLYNDARLVFKGKYNFGKAPKYWYWKKVDNADEVSYLDIEQTKYKTQPGGPSNAFQDWKRKYMRSLEDWVDGLPNVSDNKEDVNESVEIKSFDEINKELDMIYESVLSDLMLEFTDL